MINKLLDNNIQSTYLEDYHNLLDRFSSPTRLRFFIRNFTLKENNLFHFPTYITLSYFMEKEVFSTHFFKKEKIDLFSDDIIQVSGYLKDDLVMPNKIGHARDLNLILNDLAFDRKIDNIMFSFVKSGEQRGRYFNKYMFDNDSEAETIIHYLLNIIVQKESIPHYSRMSWTKKIESISKHFAVFPLYKSYNKTVIDLMKSFDATKDLDYLYLILVCYFHTHEINFSEQYSFLRTAKFMDHKVYKFILEDIQS